MVSHCIHSGRVRLTTVDDYKRANILWLFELRVAPAHDEAHGTLAGNENAKRETWTHLITGPGTQLRTKQ